MEQEKHRKILFTDLDDTLLNSEKEISEGNRQALSELLAQGHIAVISTGRALPSAIRQAKRLGLTGKNCYIICFNGGQIYDIANQKLIYRREIPLEHIRPVFEEAYKFGVNVQTYSDTHVLSERDNPSLRYYCEIQNLSFQIVEDVTQTLEIAPSKILALDYENPDRIPAFRQYLAPKLEGKLDLFLSHPSLLEIVPLGVNKGNAVRFLCDYLGIPLENSVAAGDAENDLTMIQAAHVGVAMCNGVEKVKEQADYITKADQNHDGVAEIIRKFILTK